jgi:uncharacterized surface protein with fasciclin (FAS1) repeats
MRKSPLVALLAAGSLLLVACGDDSDDTTTTTAAPAETTAAPSDSTDAPVDGPGDIVEVAVAAGSFNTLAAALEAADLVSTLQGEGPFTVFAPTDDAFAALPEGLVDALLLPENVEVLQQILLYHVIAGAEVTSADVAAGEVEMASGDTATITVDGGVKIDDANVVTVDVDASNGVIHVIDAVIVPAGVDVAALLG